MSGLAPIGICGGGNLPHAMAAYIGSKDYPVHLCTRQPARWASALSAIFPNGKEQQVSITRIDDNPQILEPCQIILISVPRFAVNEVVQRISPVLDGSKVLVFIPGVPALCHLDQSPWSQIEATLAGLYKVPLICRTTQYGHQVHILGARPQNKIWCEDLFKTTTLVQLLETLFGTPLDCLHSALPFLLTNSNPLLHPARCYDLFCDYRPGVLYSRPFLFYEEWSTYAAELYMRADEELLRICERCTDMVVGQDIIPVLDYYESRNAKELAAKLRSIKAFQGIPAPMIPVDGGWTPDLNSRYFTEDVPWGTQPIVEFARQLNVNTPVLQSFIDRNTELLRLREV